MVTQGQHLHLRTFLSRSSTRKRLPLLSASELPLGNERAHAIHWPYVVPIASVHLLALLALLPSLFSWSGVVWLLLGIHLFGTLGMNLCYHRLLTHRSFQTPKWLEHVLSTLAMCCLEDTPVRWVATHRLHHNHADEERDPHSPRETMLWAHMGWLFRRNPDLRTLDFYHKYARDVISDPYYRYLEKHPFSPVWIYLAQMGLFTLLGFVVGYIASGDLKAGWQLGASWLVWGVLLRTVMVWHITWSVNSLTHIFGYRTYDATGENSRNNWLVATLAAGEGWHNNHHHDPASASVQHRWWEFDLTYYIICGLEKVGLATQVIRPRHVRQLERGQAQSQL